MVDTLKKYLVARNYGAVERVWRTLSGQERLHLMVFCYERGIDISKTLVRILVQL